MESPHTKAKPDTTSEVEDLCREAILQELGLDRPFDYQKAFDSWRQASLLGDVYAEKRCQELIDRGYVQVSKDEERARKNRKILVIDDDGDLNYALFKLLNADGYDVITAENGVAGMKLIGLHPDIALVIVDLKMDQMNGFQFLRQVRALEALVGVPIIVCTGYANPKNLSALISYKITACITKPYDSQKLLEMISAQLFKSSLGAP